MHTLIILLLNDLISPRAALILILFAIVGVFGTLLFIGHSEEKNMYNPEFIQLAPDDSVKQECLINYGKHSGQDTINSTQVPFVTVGRYGIFSISVRYAKFGNQSPKWGYSIQCGGMTNDHGFISYEEAKEKAIKMAKRKDDDLEAEMRANEERNRKLRQEAGY